MPLSMVLSTASDEEEEIMGEKFKVPQQRKITIGRRKKPIQTDMGGREGPPSVMSGGSSGQSSCSGLVSQGGKVKGPSRYLSINQTSYTKEAPQVQSQSRVTMDNLQPRARTQSPGKSQSPVKASRILNEIREDFSPSPVVRNPPVSKAVNEKRLVGVSSLEDLSPQERLSLSFQPTPARFKPPQTAPAEEVQQVQQVEEEAVDEAVVETAESWGKFQAPSESSEVTFKLPTVPVPKKAAASTEVQEPLPPLMESRYLHSWIPRMKKGKLFIEGEYIDFDASRDSSIEENRRYVTSRIVSRISANRIATKKRVYVLEGPLVVKDFEREKNNPTPLFILDKFSNGVPENWEKILNHWAKFEERNKQNISNMSLLSSTLRSNYTHLGINLSSLSNISAINAINGSHFIPSSSSIASNITAASTSTAVNLTISKQQNISIMPEPVQDMFELEANENDIEPEPPKDTGTRPKAKISEPVDEIFEDAREVPEDQVAQKKSSEKDKVDNIGAEMFECVDCKFTTKFKRAYLSHTRSKKHLLAIAGSGGENSKSDGKRKITEEEPEQVAKKRKESNSPKQSLENGNEHNKKKRGRPRKFQEGINSKEDNDIEVSKEKEKPVKEKKGKGEEDNLEVPKRKRGRPRKKSNSPHPSLDNGNESIKRKRGRPKKVQEGKKSQENNIEAPIKKKPPLKSRLSGNSDREKSPEPKEKSVKEKKGKADNKNQDNHNQSIYGRVRKQNQKYQRQSCVYNTPEEVQEETERETTTSRTQIPSTISPTKSLRRVVLNPFRRLSSTAVTENTKKPAKDLGEILKKVSANPKTIKQRLQNAEAMKDYNEDHEDDVFEMEGPGKVGSLKTSTKSLLLSQDPDSDSDQDVSIHSARTPVTAYFGKGSLRELELDRTPQEFRQPDSPRQLKNYGYQHQAYIQRKMAEKNKLERQSKKSKLTSALTKVVSRTQMDKMVDQSTKVIGSLAQIDARRSLDLDDEPEEDWFEDDSDHLPGDAAPGLVDLLKNKI